MIKKISTIFIQSIYTLLVVAVLALALLFVGTKVDILGYEVKIVKSGSMEPAIMTGGIVVVTPSTLYEVGDVVTYGRNAPGQIPVTHRIIEKNGQGRNTTYITKGDANEDADPNVVTQRYVLGKVVFTIPYLGYVIEFARTPLGFLFLIGVPALLIILDEFANIMWEFHKYRFRKRKALGYRVPSRERAAHTHQSRTPKPMKPTAQKPAKKYSQTELELDLRHFRHSPPQRNYL